MALGEGRPEPIGICGRPIGPGYPVPAGPPSSIERKPQYIGDVYHPTLSSQRKHHPHAASSSVIYPPTAGGTMLPICTFRPIGSFFTLQAL